jgi:RNA-directed DNA polymerase
MKFETEHILEIQKQFAKMKSKEDFLNLLNFVKKTIYKEKYVPFTLKSLVYYANPNLTKKRYSSFSIRKKSGGARSIHAPARTLKSILRVLNFVFQCIAEPHKAATGFIPGKSIVDNAKLHSGKLYVYNIDLKDFFHSFDKNQVKLVLRVDPFNLKDHDDLAFFIACLCTHPLEVNGEIKTVLPQGSPCSPTLTNILCRILDKRLTGLAKRFHCDYSRYADDISFSADYSIFKKSEFQNELQRIIQETKILHINPRKTRLQKNTYRQETTGLVVNEKVNVRQRYVKQIRMWISYWEKYGFAKAESIFLNDYRKDKGHVKRGRPNFENVLAGKLDFLRMIKGNEDSTYLKLKERFDKLTENISITKVIDTWEKQGIDKAMELYYSKSNNYEILFTL